LRGDVRLVLGTITLSNEHAEATMIAAWPTISKRMMESIPRAFQRANDPYISIEEIHVNRKEQAKRDEPFREAG